MPRRRLIRPFLAIVLIVVPLGRMASARAQPVVPVEVSVDATSAGSQLTRVWAFHGYDEINVTTTSEGRALLESLAAAHTAPVHVRSHFLFNTGDGTPGIKWGSTNVYTEDQAGDPVYDWTLTDGIFDTLAATGVLPLVEIGFMPQALSIHPNPYRNAATITLDGGCFYPPKDHAKWGELVRAWAGHAKARYADVGERWLWELWNEPDSGYWHGSLDDYAKLYDHTEAALHQVLPNAVLGGPAVVYPEGSFLAAFLQHCANGSNAVTGAVGTRLDMVSFHAKGGVTIVDDHVQMDLGNQLRLHRAGFEAVAAVPQLGNPPIYITEADPDGCAGCPSTSGSPNEYRSTTAYGAYEMAMMKRTLDLATSTGVVLGGVLTWAFTFPGTPLFAGYRVLASQGISLPVLGAFKLLGRLQGKRIPLTSSGSPSLDAILASGVRDQADLDGMATLGAAGVQILMWNYHDDLVAAAATPVHLAVKLPGRIESSVRVSHLRVDDAHGNAYAVWVSQGMPAEPSPEQRAALLQAMDPAPLVPAQSLPVTNGMVNIDFDLPRFAVSLVTVEGVPASGDGEPAITDGGGVVEVDGRGRAGNGCACAMGHPRGEGAIPAGAVALAWFVLAMLARRRAWRMEGKQSERRVQSRRPAR
jgi:xylan 1,4-beta-xylosidase